VVGLQRLGVGGAQGRRAGEEWLFNKTVSVSAASTMACFQLACTGDSTAETMAVPSCTPSAPRARAAAMVGPSRKPPAAMTGRSKAVVTAGTRTMVDTGRGLLKPPPSPPSTISPSTPAATAFSAARTVGTTWKTVRPASFSGPVYRVGLPAEVVTKRTPWATTKSTMAPGSATKAWAMFTPKGRSVRSFIRAISRRTASSSPEDVSMMPMAPALETAEARSERAIHPIGAWTIGMSTPNRSVTRLRSTGASWHGPAARGRGDPSRDDRSGRFGAGSAL
jgi:hypothetical protein